MCENRGVFATADGFQTTKLITESSPFRRGALKTENTYFLIYRQKMKTVMQLAVCVCILFILPCKGKLGYDHARWQQLHF